MSGQGFGDERALAILFLSAVDAAARFYGLSERSRVVGIMEDRLSWI
ncbi:hypothetical protein [Methylobacterium goesingense]|uniref:Uncharacterized protein n=1 Tax=Methylobacterium goesingense TaxID=243690 RepID=A0ABV2L8J6_9HYPH|nr:hypothetical protein [Methylobacterium goesingense]